MAEIDPIIPKLLGMKKQSQERRLSELKTQMQKLSQKLAEIDAEFAKIDAYEEDVGRLSVENGYLRYLNHRRDSITARIESLKNAAALVQADLRKSVFTQEVLRE
jgi:prefoldin subunit 5